MAKKSEITLNERKKIQLDMLQEVHDFCVANGIRYSLAFGTLLGAIRHKGYIPWDDDVDIIMPFPDILKFKESFNSKVVKYCDVDTEPHYEYPFPRLSYSPTYRQIGLIGKSYGVNIDLYPIISLPSDKSAQKYFWDKAEKLQKRMMSYVIWRGRIIRRLPLVSIPGFDRSIRQFRDFLYDNSATYGSSDDYYIIAIPVEKRDKVIYHHDLFSQLTMTAFEDRQFQIISCYEDFLRHMYGDYMLLPPENERVPYHGGHFFWK